MTKKKGETKFIEGKHGTSAIHAKCDMPDSGECNFLPLQELLSGTTCTCSQLHTRYVTWALQKEECQWDYAGEGHHKTNRNACIQQGAKNLLAPGLCHFESLCHYARLSLCPSSAERKYTWKLHEGALCCQMICFSNPWGRWVGDHAKEGLAKFGYRLERQVEKFRNPATCWQNATTYCLNMVTWAHFSL
jgi:hypothetical protein